MLIPSQIVDFRAYNGNDRLFGAGNEITLPTVTSKTATVDLPSGDIDIPGMRTENMELEIPFTLFDREAASVISFSGVTTIYIRGSAQKLMTDAQAFSYPGIKVTAKGFAKEIDLGKLARSDKMDSKIKLTLTYIKVEGSDGSEYLEIDKLNDVFKVNGKNMRAGIDSFL